MSDIVNIISTVGFPAACFIMAGLYVKYREDKNDLKFDKLSDQHRINITEMVTAINNNTLVIQKLIDKLENKQ